MRAWCVLLVLAAVGCHRKDRFDAMLADLEGYRDRMCACTDADCAEHVSSELRAYREGMGARSGTAKASDEQEDAARKLAFDTRECRKKLSPKPEREGPTDLTPAHE